MGILAHLPGAKICFKKPYLHTDFRWLLWLQRTRALAINTLVRLPGTIFIGFANWPYLRADTIVTDRLLSAAVNISLAFLRHILHAQAIHTLVVLGGTVWISGAAKGNTRPADAIPADHIFGLTILLSVAVTIGLTFCALSINTNQTAWTEMAIGADHYWFLCKRIADFIQTDDEGRIAAVGILLTAHRDFHKADTINACWVIRRAVAVCVTACRHICMASAVETVGGHLWTVLVCFAWRLGLLHTNAVLTDLIIRTLVKTEGIEWVLDAAATVAHCFLKLALPGKSAGRRIHRRLGFPAFIHIAAGQVFRTLII